MLIALYCLHPFGRSLVTGGCVWIIGLGPRVRLGNSPTASPPGESGTMLTLALLPKNLPAVLHFITMLQLYQINELAI